MSSFVMSPGVSPAVDPLFIAITTVATQEQAAMLAREAVQARLAACAQIESIRSVYAWDGRLCDEPEWRVSFKTTAQTLAALRERVLSQHPYDTPQWLELTAQAAPAYAQWVQAQCLG